MIWSRKEVGLNKVVLRFLAKNGPTMHVPSSSFVQLCHKV